MRNLVIPRDRVVQSAFIQYNRIGSKDLNFIDMSRKSISPLILNGDFAMHVN